MAALVSEMTPHGVLTVSEVSDDDLAEECKGGLYVTFDAQSNYQKGRTFTVTSDCRSNWGIDQCSTNIRERLLNKALHVRYSCRLNQ